MKRFSRIFSLLLTVTLLVGVFALVASAETGSGTVTDTGFSNNYDTLAVGDDVPNPGNGGASSSSYYKIGGDGNNKFVSYKYHKEGASGKNCRRDVLYGNYYSNGATAVSNNRAADLLNFGCFVDMSKRRVKER